MRKAISKTVPLFFIFCAMSSAYAWDHSVMVGCGGGADPNHGAYNNTGGFLSGDFTSLTFNRWFNVTVNGSLSQFHTNEPGNQNLFTAALSIAARLYPWDTQTIHPFLLGSAGPAYLSDRKFGLNNQAANFAFQSILGAGFEFGQAKRVDLDLRFIHYSNASLMVPNQGFNINYVATLGYLF